METFKRWWRNLREVNVSDRQVVGLALIAGLTLAALVVVWLAMSTRTALLSRRLDELYVRQEQLTDEINRTWTDIGDVTAPRTMEDRARRLGFEPAQTIEYLVVPVEAAVDMTATVTVTATGNANQ